jgi:hypothetical protein
MGDWRDAARGDLAGLVELDRFAARVMVRGVHLGCECVHFWVHGVESENRTSGSHSG